MVTCPLHNWDIDLKSGKAKGEDCNCSTTYKTELREDLIFIKI